MLFYGFALDQDVVLFPHMRPKPECLVDDTRAPMLSEKRTVALDPSWFAQIGDEFDKLHMQALRAFLQKEKAAGKRSSGRRRIF